jgi:ABC-type enterochelin transport system permease subunit
MEINISLFYTLNVTEIWLLLKKNHSDFILIPKSIMFSDFSIRQYQMVKKQLILQEWLRLETKYSLFNLSVIGLFWQTFIDNISTFNVRHDELGKFLWRSILVYSTHLMYNKNQLIAGF